MKKNIFAVCILFIIILLGAVFSYADNEPVGFVSELTGNVMVMKMGKPPYVSVNINMQINVGDDFKTSSNSKVKLSFNDGSMMKIMENSHLIINEHLYTKDSKRSLFSAMLGKIKYIVSKIGSRDSHEIKTQTAVIGLKGTEVWISTYKAGDVFETKVAFHEGYGVVRNVLQDAKEAIVVREKKETTVSGDKPPTPPTSIPEETKKEFTEPFETLELPIVQEERQARDPIDSETNFDDMTGGDPTDPTDEITDDDNNGGGGGGGNNPLPDPPVLPGQ